MQLDHTREGGRLPLFTIAIPTFNRAEWLGRCVASALAQTHDSFEVLVSDNGSDDETPQVLAGVLRPAPDHNPPAAEHRPNRELERLSRACARRVHRDAER